MTDNWTVAAERIRTRNEAKQAETAAIEAAQTAKERGMRVSHQELDSAIADATQSLMDFME